MGKTTALAVALSFVAACGGGEDDRAQALAKKKAAAAQTAPEVDPLVAHAEAFAKAQATLARMPQLTTPTRIPVAIRQLTQNIVVLRDDHLADLAAGKPVPPSTGTNAMKFPASPPSGLKKVDTLIVVRGTYRRARRITTSGGEVSYVPAGYLGDVTVFSLPDAEYLGGFPVTAASHADPDPAQPEADSVTQLGDEVVLEVGAGMLRGLALFSGDAPAPSASGQTVVLTYPGPKKIMTIKILRQFTKQSLKQTNDMMGAIPAVISTSATPEEAAALRGALAAEGATVAIF